ncbi:class I SAM-dependent methyltransferase [Thiotrichales bacterium 19S9-12]|nr:class I SAM-dependent methyltransferase [Thiotrichales bacterium 19S9-11]MCF6812327.1 class I SAM-dependent methyltransferase [Thiotrichales bacterium 19S9-12]
MEDKIQFIPHNKDDVDFFNDITDGLKQETLESKIFIDKFEAQAPFKLEFIDEALTLFHKDSNQSYHIDFSRGKTYHRAFFDRTKSHLVKAIEGRSKEKLNIIDATAGFGSDTFILASRDHKVIAIEQNLIVYLLLRDALFRAEDNPETQPVAQNITLLYGNAADLIENYPNHNDIIYLDPMFPFSKKSAKVQKEMQLLQAINHHRTDDETNDKNLFEAAIQHAKKVIVKRPASGPYLADKKPSSSLTGKSNRFDIYAR